MLDLARVRDDRSAGVDANGSRCLTIVLVTVVVTFVPSGAVSFVLLVNVEAPVCGRQGELDAERGVDRRVLAGARIDTWLRASDRAAFAWAVASFLSIVSDATPSPKNSTDPRLPEPSSHVTSNSRKKL